MSEAVRFVCFAFLWAGCGALYPKHVVVDALMDSAPRAPIGLGKMRLKNRSLHILAGDFHCHVAPPDRSPHVVRPLAETLNLARAEHLDFVVLTPHLWGRFYTDPDRRAQALAGYRRLKEKLSKADTRGLLVVPGFEYTDFRYGHAGFAFADLETILAEVPVDADPAQFVYRFLERGGVLTINHPLLTPIPSFFSVSSWDLSWQPLLSDEPVPPEIAALHRNAQAYEAYNLAVTHLRDRWLLRDEEASLRQVLARYDAEILHQKRRMTPVGGSDSHGHHLRSTTFVLAEDRSIAGIRTAVLRGRTCIRHPAACSFTVKTSRGRPAIVGDHIRNADAVWVGAAQSAKIWMNGQIVGQTEGTKRLRLPVSKDECHVIRAQVGLGYSAPIYVNCSFASRI